MTDRNIPARILLGMIVSGVCLAVAVILLLSESRALQIIGMVVLAALVVSSIASDWIGAWSNERHVQRHPHLLKNEAIGETVRAYGNFEAAGGAASGFVILNGERWKAFCTGDHVPKDGELMSVTSRRGLTLCVQPQVGDL